LLLLEEENERTVNDEAYVCLFARRTRGIWKGDVDPCVASKRRLLDKATRRAVALIRGRVELREKLMVDDCVGYLQLAT
jgi:hypothetical protein